MCTCPINSTQEKPGFKVIFSYTATSKAAYLTGHTAPPHCPPPKKRIVMWGEVEGRKKDLISEPDPASAYLPSSYIFSASVSLSVVGKWSQSFSVF